MADSLEFPEVFEENRGAMCAGKLKLAAGAITFKNSKTGKLDQYQSNDVKAADWLKRARGFCLKLRLENDLIHRYDGFTEQVVVWSFLCFIQVFVRGRQFSRLFTESQFGKEIAF